MSPNGMPCKGKRADRRGRLSLLYRLTFQLLSEWNNPTQPPRRGEKKPHPQPLSEWRGGVDSIVCKQRGRFFTSKRRPLRMQESVLFKSVDCMLIDFRCPLLLFVEAGWGVGKPISYYSLGLFPFSITSITSFNSSSSCSFVTYLCQ